MKSLLFVLLTTVALSAQTFTTLYNFTSPTGPAYPAALVLDAQDNLYGISSEGGLSGAGTVFKLTTKGVLTTLYSFPAASYPSSLARDIKTGNLYGTTQSTVFKLTYTVKTGKYKYSTLYSNPDSNLSAAMLDQHDNLYGIDNTCLSSENPCLWEIPAGSAWKDIYDLDAESGAPYNMFGNVLLNAAGDLYVSAALTDSGGTAWVQQVGGNYDQFGPAYVTTNALRQDAQGDVYALAWGDYPDDGTYGTVFKESTASELTVLYTFLDGSQPQGSFSLDKSNNLYGTCYGPTWGIWELTAAGQFTLLEADTQINSGLVMDSAGNLYGTTDYGTAGLGSIWKWTK